MRKEFLYICQFVHYLSPKKRLQKTLKMSSSAEESRRYRTNGQCSDKLVRSRQDNHYAALVVLAYCPEEEYAATGEEAAATGVVHVVDVAKPEEAGVE